MADGKAANNVVVAENPARWPSKYGSLVTTTYGIGTVDGINEAGLGAHMLYLNAADLGPRESSKPGLQVRIVVSVHSGQCVNRCRGVESLRRRSSRDG
jgi:penicillin V acylase-like amidase (Ntn superfamily)